MKNLVYLGIIVTALFFSNGSNAQSGNKFGHIDFATLYSMMPGLDSVKQVFSAYNQSIQDQFMAMQTELENKFMDYQSKLGTMSDIIRTTKEAEINDLKERMDAFEVTATQDLQNKEIELSSPIIEKARKAVQEVAREGKYTYIFNSAEGLLLFSEGGEDIMDKVKTKLGITTPTPAKKN
ncbi:MAG: OmpH family outer membrane protein [Bacteroidales bacterium]